MVTRRINTLITDAGTVVACTNALRLERDATFGGWCITYDAGAMFVDWQESGFCLGINTCEGFVPACFQLGVISAAGTSQLYTNAQNIEFMQCSFGKASGVGHQTQGILQRTFGSSTWTGTLTSMFNQ